MEARFESRIKEVYNLDWVEVERAPLRIGDQMRLYSLNGAAPGGEAIISEARVWLQLAF